ncbi:hypothetical protein [Prevotella intermedia]|nr:hypothetical protein [Prevotella intermedia]
MRKTSSYPFAMIEEMARTTPRLPVRMSRADLLYINQQGTGKTQ